MSTHQPTTPALDPAIAALGATIKLYILLPRVTGDFDRAFKEALGADGVSFTYAGTEFLMGFNDADEVTYLFVVLPLGTPLPPAFADNHRKLSSVLVMCSVPDKLVAKPGYYIGTNYGFKAGVCAVDPTGKLLETGPIICASSEPNDYLTNREMFDAVTGLFIAVMSCKLVHNSDGSKTVRA